MSCSVVALLLTVVTADGPCSRERSRAGSSAEEPSALMYAAGWIAALASLPFAFSLPPSCT